jgi:preprotein translocase subunit YajC
LFRLHRRKSTAFIGLLSWCLPLWRLPESFCAKRRRNPGDRRVITPAFAQAAAPAGGADMLVQFLPFILIFIIMYFLLIRPQQRRMKTHQEMIKNLRRGDTVVLNSGMIGKVTKVIDETEAEVEIADNVRVKVIKSMVADVRNKSEPVAANSN